MILLMDETCVLWVQYILNCGNLIIDIGTNILKYCSISPVVTFIDLPLVSTEYKFVCSVMCLIRSSSEKILKYW